MCTGTDLINYIEDNLLQRAEVRIVITFDDGSVGSYKLNMGRDLTIEESGERRFLIIG